MELSRHNLWLAFVKFLEILISIWAGFSGGILFLGYMARGITGLLIPFSHPIGVSILVSLFLFAWRLVKTKKLAWKMRYTLIAVGIGYVSYIFLFLIFVYT